jgi:hypothetical protein
MNIQNLVDAVKQLPDLALNITVYENAVWCYEDDELCVNTDGDADALYERGGQTYSFDVRGCVESDDGYVVFYDADNGCGTRDTIIVIDNERAMWQ